MRIYLAGSVPKGDDEAKGFSDWRARYRAALAPHIQAIFIDPYERSIDESDFLLVFGTDCKHIKDADLVIVNAEHQLGVGTSQEMVIAKRFSKPVLTILPKGTYHRREDVVFHGKIIEDWIHPFIYAFSDSIIEDIEEFGEIKDDLFARTKDLSIIEEAMARANRKRND